MWHSSFSDISKHKTWDGMSVIQSFWHVNLWQPLRRYLISWHVDAFFHQDRPEEIHISLLLLESLMLMTYIHYMMTWQHYTMLYYYTILHIYLVRGVLMSYPLSCSDHWFEILLVYRHDKRHKDADLHLSDRIPARNMPDIQRPGTLKSKTNAMCRHCNTAAVTCLLLGRRMNQMTRWLLTINGTVSIEKKKRQFEYLNVAEDDFKHFAGIEKYL